MADDEQEIIGLTLVKINGMFHLDVVDARWSTKRAVSQQVTGGGPKNARGVPLPSGSFNEVIPKDKGLDWSALKGFSVEIFDQETRKIVVASFTGCDWTTNDGSSDNSQAKTSRAISYTATGVIKS